jgi:large subunit ribosomal protein L22
VARARTPVVEEPQEVRAQARWLRITPRKARLVVEHIRGRSVPEARTVLAFTPRAAAREVEKVLASAVANAEANHGLIGDDLIVSAAYVDEGPTIKRWRARARGRAARIEKKTCHVTLRLRPADEDGQVSRPRRQQRRQPESAPEESKPEEKAAEEKPKRQPRARKAAAKPKPKPKAESTSAKKPKASSRKRESEES